jgi:hypothetical protein
MSESPGPGPGAVSRDGREARPGRLGAWPASLVVGLVITVIYLSNGREIGAFDTVPTTLLPLSVLRGDGIHLDRFRPLFIRMWGTPTPVFITESVGHLVSLYPVGPALLAVPFYGPRVIALDRTEPGWDRVPARAYAESRKMGKWAATLVVALLGIALHRLLVGLGLANAAVPSVMACAFGSDLWSVAGQALWQHGPAALFLTLSMVFLNSCSGSRRRLLLGGLTTGMLVVVRSTDLIFALFVFGWVVWHHPRRLHWFLPAPLVLGLILIGTNLYYFETITGGQGLLEKHHFVIHGVGPPWSGDLVDGMAGTLVSPSRGLFIFSPWVALAVAVFPVSICKLPKGSLVRWLMPALVLYLVVFSKYSVWWAGGTFGPRYWIDAFPLFGVMLASGLEWAWNRSRIILALFSLAIFWSVAVHATGAYCYPSTWNFYPTDIDVDHKRLWDWRDTELSRCVRESLLGERIPIRVPGL